MICAYSGLVSGGKSYTACRDIVGWLSTDFVLTNVDLKGEGIDRYFGGWQDWRKNLLILNLGASVEVSERKNSDNSLYLSESLAFRGLSSCSIFGDDPWSWPIGDRRGHGTRKVWVVIDEAAEWIDAYNSASSGWMREFCSWLRQSAKRGQEVRLIVQHPSMLHKRVRSLVARWAWHQDMSTFRIPVLGMGLCWPLTRNICRGWFGRDLTTPEGRPEWISKEKCFFDCYETSAFLGNAINKVVTVSGSSARCCEPRYPFWLAVCALFFGVVALWSSVL